MVLLAPDPAIKSRDSIRDLAMVFEKWQLTKSGHCIKGRIHQSTSVPDVATPSRRGTATIVTLSRIDLYCA